MHKESSFNTFYRCTGLKAVLNIISHTFVYHVESRFSLYSIYKCQFTSGKIGFSQFLTLNIAKVYAWRRTLTATAPSCQLKDTNTAQVITSWANSYLAYIFQQHCKKQPDKILIHFIY